MPPRTPTDASLERAKRQRLAAEEGARAIAEVERDAIGVRKNMERLRALREARDAEAAANPPPPVVKPAKKATKRAAR